MLCGFRPSIRRPDGKYQVLRSLIAADADPGGESLGAHLPAAAVEEDGDRGGSRRQSIETLQQGRLGAERHCLAASISFDPLKILAGETVERIGGGKTRSDMAQREAHGWQNTAPAADARQTQQMLGSYEYREKLLETPF